MLEMINNFAGFNLSAILVGSIAGGIFIIIFHYLLMPILFSLLIKPLATVVETTVNFFSETVTINNQKENENKKKKIFRKFHKLVFKFFYFKSFFFSFIFLFLY